MGWQVEPPPTQLAVVPGLTVPTGIVQAATPAFSGTSPTATFPANITPGDSIICAASTSVGGAVVNPASGPDTFTQDADLGAFIGTTHGYFLHVSHSAGGYNSVTLTTAGGLWAFEIQGTVTYGSDATSPSGSGTFSVNYTPAVAAEFLLGFSGTAAGGGGITTSPAAPWHNAAVLNASEIASWQMVSATTTVTYSGVWTTGGSASLAGVGGYKLTNPGEPTPVNECLLYYFGGQLFALGSSGIPVLLAVT